MLKLTTVFRDGTTHLVMSLLELFMQRLAALVPCLHFIRFHGALAPNAKLRAVLVPTSAQATTGPHPIARVRMARRRA